MAEIEMLMLANHAEAVNGLLYVSGAGWNTVTRNYLADQGPQPHHFGIALSVLVGWNETHHPHTVHVAIEHEDGPELWSLAGELEVHRPPEHPPGTDLRAVLAIMVTFGFPGPGGYRVVARTTDAQRTTSFRVVDNLA